MSSKRHVARRMRHAIALTVALAVLPFFTASVSAQESESTPQPQQVHETNQYGRVRGATFRVYAYQEGLVGHTTANGHVIEPNDHFVALPCFCVLSSKGGSEFQVKIEYNGKEAVAPVWDVGPWNIDDNYWDAPEDRNWGGLEQGYPAAAAAFYDGYNSGVDFKNREVGSPGGIDIGDGTFADLGMTGSDWVDVTFLWLEPEKWELPPLPAGFNDIPSVWWDQRPPLDWTAQNTDGRFGYVWETGHNVPLALFDFYNANGSWQRFGLPVSEFFREVDLDGTMKYVQYFERSVLSLDMDTGEISIIPLGYRSQIDHGARQQVAAFETTPSAVFFPDTGHSLQNGFKAYWEANGGIDVFGQPLSEEWTEYAPDGRKVVVQMFEYARLEWWPDKVGTGEEITRSLLGVELLRTEGWIE